MIALTDRELFMLCLSQVLGGIIGGKGYSDVALAQAVDGTVKIWKKVHDDPALKKLFKQDSGFQPREPEDECPF